MGPTSGHTTMTSRVYRVGLLALYQLTLLLGILLMPFALVARRAGVPLPLHRAVTRLGEAYEDASS